MTNWHTLVSKLDQLLRWKIHFCRRLSNSVADSLSKLVPPLLVFPDYLPPTVHDVYIWRIYALHTISSSPQPLFNNMKAAPIYFSPTTTSQELLPRPTGLVAPWHQSPSPAVSSHTAGAATPRPNREAPPSIFVFPPNTYSSLKFCYLSSLAMCTLFPFI